jgi:phosphoenolpyruvate---glycerone phosphotransferase subunit DhaL
MMEGFLNASGKSIVLRMISDIQTNKVYLSEIDGLIGDGDHGMNMNKGFSICREHLDQKEFTFTQCLSELGDVLFNEIGGSMGPIYGSIFSAMAEYADQFEFITASVFEGMLDAGLTSLHEIVQAQVGDKTLVDTLSPALDAFRAATNAGKDFKTALADFKQAAEKGMLSTRDLIARFGRSSRLGERSRGVLDAGAVSCNIILQAMADEMMVLIQTN